TEPADATAPAEPAATVAAAPAEDTELPIELLNSMNIQGTHHIESLVVAGWQLSAINATLTVQDGRLNFGLEEPAGFYNGTLAISTSLDARQNPPLLTSINSLRNVNVA